MTDQFTPGNDILDSREIQARLDEIRALPSPRDPWDVQEYWDLSRAKRDILDEFDHNYSWGSPWDSGIILISESYWEEYAQQTAYDVGMIEEDGPMSSYVDWGRWADALKMDYSHVEVGGYSYYGRE